MAKKIAWSHIEKVMDEHEIISISNYELHPSAEKKTYSNDNIEIADVSLFMGRSSSSKMLKWPYARIQRLLSSPKTLSSPSSSAAAKVSDTKNMV